MDSSPCSTLTRLVVSFSQMKKEPSSEPLTMYCALLGREEPRLEGAARSQSPSSHPGTALCGFLHLQDSCLQPLAQLLPLWIHQSHPEAGLLPPVSTLLSSLGATLRRAAQAWA